MNTEYPSWEDMNRDINELRAFTEAQTPKPQKRSKAGKKRRKTGEAGEKKAQEALNRLGFQRVRKNPPAKFMSGNGTLLSVKGGADFTAITGDGSGRVVHAEVKTWNEDTLTWSALKPHQRDDLDEINRLGGVALLIWVRKKANGRYQTMVIPWPVPGFGPGRQSIRLADVERHEVISMKAERTGQLGLL